jgi:hypothetical protein
MSLIDLDDHRPCVLINTGENNYAIVPRVVFDRLISGDLKASEVDNIDAMLPTIIREWLDGR